MSTLEERVAADRERSGVPIKVPADDPVLRKVAVIARAARPARDEKRAAS